MTVAVGSTIRTTSRTRVIAWAAWDWGSAAFNAVITTFVFTVYLTSAEFIDPSIQRGTPAFVQAQAHLTSALSFGVGIAGVAIGVLAPATGRLADLNGARRPWLAVTSLLLVLTTGAMFLVVGAPAYFPLGVSLVAVGTVIYDIAYVNYNAMLPRIAPRDRLGRVSAIGWAAGYFGGIVLLLLLYVTLIAGSTHVFGISDAGGLNIRIVALCCAVWTAVFSIPVLLAVPEVPRQGTGRAGLLRAYADVFRLIARLWRRERGVLAYLVASAVFRDGLTGVFLYGGIIASHVFGFSSGAVILFAIAANVVAGISTVLSGPLDDRIGPKPVIIASLVGLVLAGAAVFALRSGGPAVFWTAGLALCLFVGPAQSAARTFMAGYTTPDTEGELFGLYQTTGKAATVLAPTAFGLFAAGFGNDAYGILGIVVVLVIGLGLLIPVRHPARV